MSAIATAIVGGTIIGGVVASKAAGKAADTQSAAARYAGDLEAQASAEATEESKRQFDLAREDYGLWRDAGKNALTDLQAFLKDPQASYEQGPYYNFLLSGGTKAIERSAAAKGQQLSGKTLKALEQYGQNIAGAGYDDYWTKKVNPLIQLAGLGQTATAGTTSAGTSATNQITNALMQGAQGRANAALYSGNAQAGGTINKANALTGMLDTGLQNYMMWKYSR